MASRLRKLPGGAAKGASPGSVRSRFAKFSHELPIDNPSDGLSNSNEMESLRNADQLYLSEVPQAPNHRR
jgi:hypothetical protein